MLQFLEDMKDWPPRKWFSVALIIFFLGVLGLTVAWILGAGHYDPTTGARTDSFDNYGPVGDYFGGMMAPFIGLIGAFLTFAAFYIQYKANEEQKKALADQGEQIKEQKEQQRIDRFEQRFFEMLRIQREILSAMSIKCTPFRWQNEFKASPIPDPVEFRGNQCIQIINCELEATYRYLKLMEQEGHLNFPTEFKIIHSAYDIVYSGANTESDPQQLLGEAITDEQSDRDAIRKSLSIFIKRYSPMQNSSTIGKEIENIFKSSKGIPNSPTMLHGYSDLIDVYFRHMYQIFKQLKKFQATSLNPEEKQEYAKMFRAQMTNDEMKLLYYHSLWEKGDNWWADNIIPEFYLLSHLRFAEIPIEISPIKKLKSHLKSQGLSEDWNELARYFVMPITQEMMNEIGN